MTTARAKGATSDKPADVNLNLDTIEEPEAAGPFVFVSGGEHFEIPDMRQLDWQDLISLNTDVERGVRAALGEKQFEKFSRQKGITITKLQALLEQAAAHFGLNV